MKLLRNIIAIVLLFFAVDVGRYFFYPDIGRLSVENPSMTAFMEYREAQWKQEGLDDKRVRQRWVPLDRVSSNLVKAVLIAEDNKFWQHRGFDYEAIEMAIEKNIEAREFKSGASTISQQLAKNLYLSPSRNPVRKIKEAILTWRIEKTLSKRRILELYVNVAEWGDGIFGIEQAARTYYGVSAAGISPQQAARLAAVLPNPLKYSPVNPSRYVRNRARRIYAIMIRRGVVLPDYKEVMTISPDTTAVDSVVTGVPDYLIRQAASSDSTASGAAEQNPPPEENGQPVVGNPEGADDDAGSGTSNP
ncbi:monofunctional biosynthetic peptidoglycan transglycosylase [Chlorobium sp.]|uniref:monofunctional biosynthetic peptidoglycan transglycosylase n=1 Tax=Chlorobium sp. TaxID=1095 RepID=UPI002F3FA5F0